MDELAYMYPTKALAEENTDWITEMLANWQKGGKHYLSFPFLRFHVNTLPDGKSFWLYMYYRKSKTDIPGLKGKIRYRIHIVDWNTCAFDDSEVFKYDFPDTDDERTLWFKCDRFEELVREDGKLLSFHDFRHALGKAFGSAMRSSIPPVICQAQAVVVRSYPSGKS